MSNPLSPNQRNRFSRDGFERLIRPSHERERMGTSHTNNTGDVTIDIPLTQVASSKSTGARRPPGLSPRMTHPSSDLPTLNEKTSHKLSPFGHRHNDSDVRGRRRLEVEGMKNKDTADGSANVLGRFYDKVYHFSVITRYMLYVAPVAALIAVPLVVGATVAQHARIGGVQLTWFFTWIEVLWCSLWISKLFAKFLPYLFQFVVGVVSSGTRKYALVIQALEIPLSLVFWALCSLTTFVPLMTLNPDQRSRGDTGLKGWQNIMKNILFACLFSTLVLLGEKLIIQLISISYHRKQFDEKIKDSKRNIYLTGLLYEASRTLFPSYCHEFAQEDFIIADVLDIGLASRGGKSHARSGSATPMKLFQNAVKIGDKVTAAFGNVAHEITGKQVFNSTSAHSVVIDALEKKKASEALAQRIWLSFVLEGRDALYLDDIKDVLGIGRETEAEEAFACLDADGNGDISLEEMVLRIGEFGRERASIANSMRDVDQAINVLDNLLCTVVFIMVIFIFVAWLNTNFTTTLATTGTALLSLSFVFAATAQEVLGSCIFLFVKHPYDVGDRVDISDKQYIVERISLLYTLFRCVANNKRTQVPNIVLNSNWIDNVSRSKAMREQILLYISFDTSLEDIELLRNEMQKFVLDKENARDFQPNIDIEITGLAEMNKMELKVEIRHKSNWAIESVRAARRNKFMCALVLALRKVPINGPGGGGAAAGDKANPTYSVAISHTEAEENKTIYAKDKEASRMIPTTTIAEAEGTSSGTDFFSGSDVETRERAQAMGNAGLTHRSPSTTTRPLHNPAVETAVERQRSQDIEEVRNILRKESTSQGRRKAHQHDALSPTIDSRLAESTDAVSRVPAINQPTLAYAQSERPTSINPPPVPSQAAASLSAREDMSHQRVSYYEDGNDTHYGQQVAPQISLPPAAASPFAVQPSQTYPSATSGHSARARSDSQTQRKPVTGQGQR